MAPSVIFCFLVSAILNEICKICPIHYPMTIDTNPLHHISSQVVKRDGPSQSTAYAIKQIGTSQIADGAITESKLASDISPSPPWVYLTFEDCQGTNQNHDVICQVHDETGITEIDCNIANPAILDGDNVGDSIANTGWHLRCTIPPLQGAPGIFGCDLLST